MKDMILERYEENLDHYKELWQATNKSESFESFAWRMATADFVSTRNEMADIYNDICTEED